MIIYNFNKIKYFCLIFIILISFWRSPFIFLNGRFVAEEATHHLFFALTNSFFSNIFYYDTFAGYYNLIANFFLEIASKIPLEFSPFITVYGSLFFIILLPYLCLFRDSLFLDNNNKKIIGAFVLFLSPPFVSEVWVNSINLQIYFCLIAILILFMENLDRKQKILNNTLIFLGAFSGIYTCALIPFYILKFIKEKIRYNLYNLLILLAGNVLQIFLIIKAKIYNTLDSTVLSNDINFDLFINFFYNVFAKAILARQLTHFLWGKLNLLNIDYVLFFLIIGLFFLIISIFYFKQIRGLLKKDKILIYLISIFLIISSIVVIGGAGNYVGGRYAVIPGALIVLIILHLSFQIKQKFPKTLFATLLTLSIFTGGYEFRPPTENVKHQYIKQLDCVNCPIWSDEIKKWRYNKDHIIGIWPYPRKELILGNIETNN